MTTFYVTSTGTDVGKTYVACQLIAALRRQNIAVSAVKPVLSGFDEFNAAQSDAGKMLEALGRQVTADAIQSLSPWRFSAPLSPDMASRLEGRQVALEEIVKFCQDKMNVFPGICLIEGAGGIMSPLGQGYTNLDLIAQLQAAVIFVTGSYLGAISHTLTALECLHSRDVRIAAVMISETEAQGVSIDLMKETLKDFGVVDIDVILRCATISNATLDRLIQWD